MQKSISSLVLRVVLVLLVVLWHVPTAAQSTCPELKVSDFKVNYYAANADCGTAGQIIVTYRNNVAGFSKLTYETSTDGATWANPVEQTSLSVPTTIPLTGWAAGQTIHLRVTGTCPSGTQEVTFPTLTHRSEQPHAVAPVFETTPAGGCSATAGSIDVSVGEVSGFTKAEYFLYQGTTLLNSMTSNTPYAESTFYNLPSGTYKVVMRATPACTPASPTAAFKNGAYEVEEMVKVGYFSILPSPIPTRGTACAGGVRVAVARVMGVNGLKYEVLPSGGGAALQTEQLVYPNFTHTFLNLPSGNYELRATSDCGTVETVPFTVPIGGAGTLSASALQGTYAHCSIGKISATVPGTSVACPVDYTLTPNGGGAPTTQLGVTEESVVFEGLAPGNYTISATWAGQTQSATVAVPIVSLGDLKVTATRADYFCDPTGTLKVELENGVYLDNSTLILYNEGTPVRTLSLSKTDRTKTLSGLVPGAYTLKFRTTCGEELNATSTISSNNSTGITVAGEDNGWSTPPTTGRFLLGTCSEGLPLQYAKDYSAAQLTSAAAKRFVEGATYELYYKDKLLGSGLLPALKDDKWTVPVAASDIEDLGKDNSYVKFKIIPACGTPAMVFNDSITSYYTLPSASIAAETKVPSPDCEALGSVEIKTTLSESVFANLSAKLLVYKVGTTTPIYDDEVSSTVPRITLRNLATGDYTYELMVCGNRKVSSGTFKIEAKLSENIVNKAYSVTPASCGRSGAISYSFFNDIAKVKFTLRDQNGTTYAYTNKTTAYITYEGLPAGTYTLSYLLSGNGTCSTSGSLPPTIVPEAWGHSGRGNVLMPYSILDKGDFCTNNQSIEVHLSDRQGKPLSISGSVTYKAYDTNGHLLETKVATSPDEKITFNNLPEAGVKIVAEVGCGEVYVQIGRDYWQRAKKYPENAIDVKVVPYYPGCQAAGVVMTSDLLTKGYAQMPTKVYLYDRTGNVAYDSIASSSVIERAEFTNLTPGLYYKIRYVYCGANLDKTVYITAATAMNVTASVESQTNPCELGKVNIRLSPEDPNLSVHYEVTNHTTGALTLDETHPGINTALRLPAGTYDIKVTYSSACIAAEKMLTATVPKSSLNIGYRSHNLTCHSNGIIEAYVYEQNKGGLSKMEYILQNSSGGTPQTAETTDPTEVKKFIGLPPGTYKLIAKGTCIDSEGNLQTYTKEQDITLPTSYTAPLTVVQNPDKHKATYVCPAQGVIGLSIGGSNSNYWRKLVHVYVIEDPNGPVSPQKELKPISEYSYEEWGGDLIPGTYKLWVTDGCMDVTVPNVVVPAIPEVAKVTGLYQCVEVLPNSCSLQARVKIDFSALSQTEMLKFWESYYSYRKFPYEIAVVPPGGNRTTQPWSSENSYGSTSDRYVVVTDTFPSFNVSAGVDVLLRLKSCPSIVKRVSLSGINLCNIAAKADLYEDRCMGTLNLTRFSATSCQSYDIIVRKGSVTGSIVKQKTITNYGWEKHNFEDLQVPNDDTYFYQINLAGTSTQLWQEQIAPYTYTPYMTAIIYNQTTTCTGEYYTWDVGNLPCMGRGRFIVRDSGMTEIERSPLMDITYSARWKSNTFYARNQRYYIDFVRENGTSYFSTIHQHVVSYALPTSYYIGDYVVGNKCPGNGFNYPSLGEDYTALIPQYPSGTQDIDKRIPKILRIEFRNTTTGEVFYCDEPFWNQSRDTYHSLRIWGPSGKWMVQLGGVVKPVYQLTAGNYVFTVTEDCGPKTGTFKVTTEESIKFEMHDPIVTMDCDGKLHVTPQGRAYFPSGKEPVSMSGYCVGWSCREGSYKWGQSFSTYNAYPRVYLTAKFQDGSTCSSQEYQLDLSRYFLNFDGAQSLSFFCPSSHQGVITIGLKAGHPPYTYILKKLDGTVVDTHANVNGATTFYTGQLGETYRIDATDNCGLTYIHQDVQLQAPAKIGLAMSREVYFCEGEQLTYTPINLVGATYSWTGPNGFSSTNPQLSFTATAARAGTYLLKVLPNTCTTTIDATIKVHVVKVQEVPTTTSARVCAGQTTTINIGAPTVVSDGLPSTLHKYQWQINDDLSNANGWKGIAGATSEQLTYAPPYTGTYYVRRVTVLGNCSGISGVSTITVDPGMTQTVSNEELNVTIDHKNPFTLTAGLLSGSPTRSYQWQRSLDKTSWTNIASATNETFTETQRYGSTVYYKRVTTSGTCVVESPIITVRFKKRYPAMVNPHLRQRVLTE